MNTQMSSALNQGDITPVVLKGISQEKANQENSLVTKEVEFLGDSLLVVKDEVKDKLYTSVGYICKGIGFNKDQKDRQVKNIQSDLVLHGGCVKFDAGVIDPNNEVLAIELDYLPIWLAKISITPKMKEQQPELVERLVEYQLKAKDVLAEAFIHKQRTRRLTPQEELRLHYQVLEEQAKEIESVREEVTGVREEVTDLKDNMPLFNVECKELQALVRSKGVQVLGGYKSTAYNDHSLRGKVYSDIQRQLKREFGISKYEAIKRSQLDIARSIVEEYKAPTVLVTEISNLNNQMRLA